jgi:esterase/lipase
MENLTFEIDEDSISVCRFSTSELLQPIGCCVFLHGAGSSDKSRTFSLAEAISCLGYTCITFDFPGHGESTSNRPMSLYRRFEVAKSIINQFARHENLILLGFSMSGQTVVDLIADNLKPKKLVLFAPGIYSIHAFKVPFGQDFSNIIRERNSWKESSATSSLRNYFGKLLIFQSMNDNIIPVEVINLIFGSAINVERKEVILLRDAPHQIGLWLSQNTKENQMIAEMIALF